MKRIDDKMLCKKIDLEKMPLSCSECPYFEETITTRAGKVHNRFLFCSIGCEMIFGNDAPGTEKDVRAAACPLVEI